MTIDQDFRSGGVVCPYKKKSWPKERNGAFKSIKDISTKKSTKETNWNFNSNTEYERRTWYETKKIRNR